MIEIPASLVERLKSRQVVLVTGLGCSELVGAPGWNELARRLGNRLAEQAGRAEIKAEIETLLAASRRADANAYLAAKLPREVIADVVAAAYPSRGEAPESVRAVIRAVMAIAWRGIITTGYDDMFEVALAEAAPDCRVFGPDETADFAQYQGKFLLHLCGTAAAPDSLSLGAAAARARLAASGLEGELRALSGRRSFVLVGFRPGDPDLTLVSQLLGGGSHFLLFKGAPGFEAELLESELGVTAVPYDGDLEEALGALAAAWASVAESARPADDDVEAWLEVAARSPDDPEPRAALARAEAQLREGNEWERVVELLLARIELAADRDEQVATLREVGRIYEEALGAPDRAFAAYSTALRLDPDAAGLYAAAERVAERGDLWRELAAEYGEIVAAIEDGAQAARHAVALGRVHADRLGDPGAASAAFERALAAAPPPADAGVAAEEALERLYTTQERWADLARLLAGKAARPEDPAGAARVRRARAELLADKLGDPAGAIAELEAALALEPRSRETLRSLERLYEREGRDADYLRTVESLAEVAESDAERLLLLRRLALEWEGSAPADGASPELDRAADAFEKILEIDPRDREAARALGRIHRQGKRWPALALVLERRRTVSDDPAEKRALAASLGELYDRELGDPTRALDAYAAAEAEGDAREETLLALVRLCEQAWRWPAAVAALEKLGGVAREPAARAEALARAAAIAAERLADRAAAERLYARVLEVDPAHGGALAALAALHRGQGEPLRAAKLLREAEAHAASQSEKVRLRYELAVLYQDELGDPEQAAGEYGRVLELDPEHAAAAERLAAHHARAERWAELRPLLEMLARKADRADAARAADLFFRLGETARHLDDLESAAGAFQSARELAPDARPVLRGYGDLRFERGEWREAGELYRALVAGHEGALAPPERVEILWRLGRAAAETGAADEALDWYGKAFALDPGHRPSLDAMAALHAQKGDTAALIADKRALLALATDDDTRARLSEEIGGLYLDRVDDRAQAIIAFEAVLAVDKTRRSTLHKLLELYTTERRWSDAAATLERLAEAETAPDVRAKYLYAAAVIRRDELKDTDGAAALLGRALDDAPELGKALDALERLLTETGAWKDLARAYRKLIKRLPPDGHNELRLRLWSGLGELSLARLADVEMAAAAFEMAASLDAGNVKRREQLADVYVQAGPDHYEKAIAEHQAILAQSPERLASYRALAKLYGEVGAYDKLWCVSATLAFLRKADPERQRFFEEHRPRGFRPAKRAFNDEIWQKLLHPHEDRFLDAVFMLLGPFVAAQSAQQHQAVGLRRKERVDVAADPRPATRVLRYVSETLELPAPDLFFRQTEPQGLSLYNLQERGVLTPAFVVGRTAEQRGGELELVFEMGKRMAFLRPERFVRYAAPSMTALDIMLRAALVLAGAPIGAGSYNGEVDRLTGDLRRLVPRTVSDELATVGRELVSARGEVIDLSAWMAAADLTAARVGFSLTNDLPAAARVISTEPAAASPLSAKERLKDLLAYSVSEEYFAVRKFLGLEVM
jgi:tetratricopeptide (TPR) repeat protein